MKLNHFFRIGWAIQLLVGIGLFSVSFLIENQVLQAFLSAPFLALFLALMLEIGKAVSIIWHRFLSIQSVYPIATQTASVAFRSGLVLLSLLCSMLFLANHLDRPNLEIVRNGEIQEVQQHLDDELSRLDIEKRERNAQLRKRQDEEYADIVKAGKNRIEQLERELRTEMDNVVRGKFKGPRYAEFERLLQEAKTNQKTELATMAQRHFNERAALHQTVDDDIRKERKLALQKSEQQRQALLDNDFANDERVNDPHIVAFLKIAESVFHATVEPLQFVFVFSILLSVLMEVGILLAFDTVTLVLLPSIKARHETEVETDGLKSDMASEAEREQAAHDSELDRVARHADKTIKEAESMADKFKDEAA